MEASANRFRQAVVNEVHWIPVKVLGLLVLDFLVLPGLWIWSGKQNYSLFLENSVSQFSFLSSLVDLTVLQLIRSVVLMPAFWKMRSKNGLSVLSKCVLYASTIGTLLFSVAKLVLVSVNGFMSLYGIPDINATYFVFTFLFIITEILVVVYAIRKDESLKKSGYTLIDEDGFDTYQDYMENQGLDNYDEDDDPYSLKVKRPDEKDKDGNPIKENKDNQPKRRHASLTRVLALAVPEIPMLIVGMIALVISSLSFLAMPAFFGQIVNAITVEKDRIKAKEDLARATIIISIIFVVGGIATTVRGWLFTLAGQRLVTRVRTMIFAAILVKDVSFFDKNRTGELTNRLASDTEVLQNGLTVNISMAIRYVVQAIGSIFLLFFISWKLTLVMLSVVPVIAVVAVIYGRYMQDLRKVFQDKLAAATATAEEALSSIRTVRSFARERKTQKEYSSDVMQSYEVGRKLALSYGIFGGVLGIFAQGAISLVVWYGGSLVLDGQLDTGTLLSFLLYTMSLAFAFAFLTGLFGEFMQSVGAAERIFEIIDKRPRIPVEGGIELNKVNGQIQISNVSFTYPTRPDTQVLKDITLSLSPGKVVALVGPSGGGKSTVVSLIERFYDPTNGYISLDGENLKKLNPAWYRRQIGYVSQEPVLFATSVKENIKFGNESVTDEQIIAAAKLANAHEFISLFEQEYDTLVGERGVRLSGGQKQRIAIARALVLNPTILLLDEATSALDAESEHLVQQAIDRAMQNRTVLVIAHRLSTVQNADKVVVISKGQIIEQGKHEELLAKGGVYKQLVKRQLQHGAVKDVQTAITENVGDDLDNGTNLV